MCTNLHQTSQMGFLLRRLFISILQNMSEIHTSDQITIWCQSLARFGLKITQSKVWLLLLVLRKININVLFLPKVYPLNSTNQLAAHCLLNPFTSNIWSVILLTADDTISVMLVRGIWYWINWQSRGCDILLYSYHLPSWYCIDIVRRNSVLWELKNWNLLTDIFLETDRCFQLWTRSR